MHCLAFLSLEKLPLFSPSPTAVFDRRVLWPLLTSCNLAVCHHTGSAGVNLTVLCRLARPPRVNLHAFPSPICRIYTTGFGQYWTSCCFAHSSAPQMPYMRFLFVRPRVCIRLLSDSTSRWTPLPSANSSCCQACSGLSPPSLQICRAHKMRERQKAAPCFYTN